MSYARFGKDSGVFVLDDGRYTCMACRLIPKNSWFDDFHTESLLSLLRHLKKHERVGHKIPKWTMDRVSRELRNENYEKERQKHSQTVPVVIETKVPPKWRFVDIETGDIWRWIEKDKKFVRGSLKGLNSH